MLKKNPEYLILLYVIGILIIVGSNIIIEKNILDILYFIIMLCCLIAFIVIKITSED